MLGASPVFAEVEEASFNLDPKQLEGALAAGKKAGLNMVGIMAVGLFGQPANLPALSWPSQNSMDYGYLMMPRKALEPAGIIRLSGNSGRLPLPTFLQTAGCYGDGGAIFTADDTIAEIARSCRIHGQGMTNMKMCISV